MKRLKIHDLRSLLIMALVGVAFIACSKGPEKSKQAPESVHSRSATLASQLAAEIYRDVYGKSLTDRNEFAGWANVLSQGASVEGVYRGFVLSKEYRLLEEKGPRICSKALDYFASEAAQIKKKPKEEFLERFKEVPFFTAKRVLGEALLTHLDEIAQDSDRVSTGFGKWVERSNATEFKTAFGSKARDDSTAESSREWARTAALDSIKWEALNRMHRVMNALCLAKGKEN